MENLNTKYYSYLSSRFYNFEKLKYGQLDWSLECDIQDYNLWAVLEMLRFYESKFFEKNNIYKITDYKIVEFDNETRIGVYLGLWKTSKDSTQYIRIKMYINKINENIIFEIGE